MKKILIVEDNDANLYLIRYILQNLGVDTFEARNGRDAIQLAGQINPDMIIMDIQLPDINGLETTRAIRLLPGGKDTVIIAITSYAMPGDRQRAMEAGCNDYMEKPIEPEVIIPQLKKYLSIKG